MLAILAKVNGKSIIFLEPNLYSVLGSVSVTLKRRKQKTTEMVEWHSLHVVVVESE